MLSRCKKLDTIFLESVLSQYYFFLQMRLNDEQHCVVQAIQRITIAESATEFISTCQPFFISCDVTNPSQFIDSALENFKQMKPRNEVAENDYRVRLYIMLKYSKSPVTEFLPTFIVVCPHSMRGERGVLTYNLLHSKQRQSFSEDTLVDRLLIHWNGLPTAHYDPRPVVQKFLMVKNRRSNFPIIESYSKREFIQHFFSSK